MTEAGKLTIKGALTADGAVLNNLVVDTLKTHPTGKRVEILKSTNTLSFYDQNGDQVLYINDAVGFDFYDNPLAGMMVKNPSNGLRSYVAASGILSHASTISFSSINLSSILEKSKII